MHIETDAVTVVKNTLQGLPTEYSKSDEDRLERACVIGKTFCELKKVGEFKGGAFDAYVQKHFKIKKSWRCLTMKLHTDRAKIPTVREWAEKHILPNATASDVYKLLHEWEQRDTDTNKPRTKPGKIVLELSDFDKERITVLHAVLTDHETPLQLADKAELRLYRMASASGLPLDKLLKRVKLALPEPRPEAFEDEIATSMRSGETERTSVYTDSEQGHQGDMFSPPSTAPTLTDLDPSAPKWTPLGWKDKDTGEDISEERERHALAMVYKAREQTLQPDTISRKLAKLGIKLPPTKVEKFMSTKKS